VPADNPGSGRIGGDRPVTTGPHAQEEPGPPARSLVVRLVIADTEPVSGSVGPQHQPAVRIDFSGWIGLMSAINELRAGQPGTSAGPLER
jgi:hypothetical protein